MAPLLVAKLLISLGLLFVEDKHIDTLHVEAKKNSYMYSFPNFFTTTLKQKAPPKKVKSTLHLGNIKLKACYLEKGREFVIVNERNKTLFIDLHSEYKGAKLVEIKRSSATFLKDGTYTELTLVKEETIDKVTQTNTTKQISNDKYVNVIRDSFKKYMNNPQKALRDVRFAEIRKNKNFVGLRLSFIRKGSFFDKMKLKKGDVIKSVNGNELKSMMDLLPYYNLLENSTTLMIGFERNGETKEIMYEIN